MTTRPDSDSGIRAWLGRAFLTQALLISAAAVIGVFLASAVLEGVLIRAALQDEMEHFWRQRDADPQFQLPNTRNLRGHFESGAPASLRSWSDGYHDWESGGQHYVVFISERHGQRLFLVFDQSNVARLAAYYGLAPLAAVLLVLYLSSWLGFQRLRRAVSPVITLARQVRALEAGTSHAQDVQALSLPANADEEVRELTDALLRYSQRLAGFLDREREFTRDASHELRSPLTVIRMAAELLLDDPKLQESSRRSALRIQRAALDMEELTTSLLLLARESETGLPVEAVCLNELLAEELERARALAGDKPVAARLEATRRLFVDAPEKVLSVMLGNLLRNAFLYTGAGEVVVEIGAGAVRIRDTGCGIPSEKIDEMFRPFVRGDGDRRNGHGVGLTLVRRISDRFGWPVHFRSEVSVGTTVEVQFPASRHQPLG
jgi:signal transduction histidine kinase